MRVTGSQPLAPAICQRRFVTGSSRAVLCAGTNSVELSDEAALSDRALFGTDGTQEGWRDAGLPADAAAAQEALQVDQVCPSVVRRRAVPHGASLPRYSMYAAAPPRMSALGHATPSTTIRQ